MHIRVTHITDTSVAELTFHTDITRTMIDTHTYIYRMHISEDEKRIIQARFQSAERHMQHKHSEKIKTASANIRRRLRKDDPCGHTRCHDKYTCGHKCCKYTLDWAAATKNQRGWLQSKEALFIRCFYWDHRLPYPRRDDSSWDYKEPEYEWFNYREWLLEEDEEEEIDRLMDRIEALNVEEDRLRQESAYLWRLIRERRGH